MLGSQYGVRMVEPLREISRALCPSSVFFGRPRNGNRRKLTKGNGVLSILRTAEGVALDKGHLPVEPVARNSRDNKGAVVFPEQRGRDGIDYGSVVGVSFALALRLHGSDVIRKGERRPSNGV